MLNTKSLVICLDLTEMDTLLIRYTAYLCDLLPEVEEVLFTHNINFEYEAEAAAIVKSLDQPLETVIQKSIEEDLEDHFQLTTGKAKAAVKVTQHTFTAQQLSKTIKSVNADLVIVGKKSSYPGTGIVAKKMIRVGGVKANILLVPEIARLEVEVFLAAIDFSSFSLPTIKTGLNLSNRLQNGRFLCQHVLKVPATYFPYLPVGDVIQSMARDAEKSWNKFRKKNNLPEELECTMTPNAGRSVATTVYQYALEKGADLIILGRKGRNNLPNVLLGSTTIRMIELPTHIPILILQ